VSNKEIMEIIKQIDEYEDQADALYDKVNVLETELRVKMTELFRDEQLLAGTWKIKQDMHEIYLTAVKLKNEKLFKFYISELINAGQSTAQFWTPDGNPGEIIFNEERMKISTLNWHSGEITKFVNEHGITLVMDKNKPSIRDYSSFIEIGREIDSLIGGEKH